MILCLPTCANDSKQLHDLLIWISQLGEQKSHDALIVVDSHTPWNDCNNCRKVAENIFREVRLLVVEHVEGWPKGPNALFRTAANYIANQWPQSFLWLEADAIPLKAGWLDAIAGEYQERGKKYLGCIYRQRGELPHIPKEIMSGVAVYHADTAKELPNIPESPNAWDMDCAEIFVRDGAHTKLIFHLWGEKGNPPRFATHPVPGTAIFSLDQIPKAAVVYHRNKDGSLIRQLRRRMGIRELSKVTASKLPLSFVVVLPFFTRDAQMALKNMQWQRQLGGSKDYDCLLAFEGDVNPLIIDQIQSAAQEAYRTVFLLRYPKCPIPGWPSGPNWAFQHTANYMQQLGRSWLWMETDMWPLVPHWLDSLQEEYGHCGKAFMGHVVKDFGHLQGTSIYPPDLPTRCPKAMTATNIAFDTVSKAEMLADCHPANELFGHIWGLHGDTPHHFTGIPIHFSTIEQVKKWVPQGAVTLHRCKDGSIVDRLREMHVA